MSGPLVSVLTPSFNQAEWLGDNLKSVSCQGYEPIEHIVMDGASTDGTLDLLRAAEGVDWASEPDRGQSHAINKAFARANGEVIGWLNSDDAYFDCNVIGDVMRLFSERPDIDVIYGHCAYVDERGLLLHYFWAPRFSARWLRRYDFIIQPAVFIRRTAIADVLVDESYHFAMDYELWLRLLSAGRHFHRMDRVLAIDRGQRQRKSSTSLDILSADIERLGAMYGVEAGKWPRSLSAAHAVGCRIRGASLAVRRVDPSSLAFSAQVDGSMKTLVRQCLTRRKSMEVG